MTHVIYNKISTEKFRKRSVLTFIYRKSEHIVVLSTSDIEKKFIYTKTYPLHIYAQSHSTITSILQTVIYNINHNLQNNLKKARYLTM